MASSPDLRPVGPRLLRTATDDVTAVGTPEDEKNVPIDALGEGQNAPGAAAEVAKDVETEKIDVPPGAKGWLSLLGAILVNSICYGFTNSFGLFQDYYVTHQLQNSTATDISWICSIQLCLCPLLGCFSGPLFDAGYLKHLLICGGTIYVLCMFMTSISKEYYQFLLAHGIGVGIGMGTIFSPSVSTLSHHFGKSKYRSLAYGMQASGSCIGGIMYPILGRVMLPRIGFGWTLRVFGFWVLIVVVSSFFCLSTTHPPRKRIAILSPSVFRTPGYGIFVGGSSLSSLSIYAPFTFSVTYGVAHGLSTSLSNYALSISNATAVAGRVAPLILAQFVGPCNIQLVSGCLSGIMLFTWTKARTASQIIAYLAMYGITSGGYAAAFNASAASYSPHPNQTGLYLGMAFFTTSFFWLAGTPATAALIRGEDYLLASIFCGAVVLGGGSLLGTARFIRVRHTGTPWV